MQLSSPSVLRTVFALKGNFAAGALPAKKVFSGIELAPFKNGAQAAACISADFEMNWAWRAGGREVANLRGTQERANVPFILRLLDQYSIPITWATVGHLFLSSCERSSSGFAHAHMPRPKFNDRWNGDWYLHAPCSDVEKDPLWYAPDLVQQILDSRTRHEIGTHSFSHINFSERYSTPELIHQELEACGAAMRPFGLSRPRSLVFPHNVSEYSYLPLLAETGIVAVRHRDSAVRLSYPERTVSGVYKITESMNLRPAKYYDYAEKAKIFIQEAAARNAAYSLWFHPSDPSELFDVHFRRILEHINAERNAGRVWVATMGDLAAYCEARERVQISVERGSETLTLSFRNSVDSSRFESTEITVLVPITSRPTAAWLELADGRLKRLNDLSLHNSNPDLLLINVPTTAKILRLIFK